MPYNYITKDNGLFDQKIRQGLLTDALGQPEVTWLAGGKSFTLTTITTSGFQPHTRNKGYNSGTVNNDKKVYTMGQDRDIEFYVDRQDVDETNMDLAVANISKTFIEENASPEIDAYRFATIASKALEAKQSKEIAITAANAYSAVKDAIKPLRKYGAQNLIGYLSSNVMDCLERSTEFTRSITNQNVGQTALESRITSLDGVTLIEVWDDSRFKSAFDFTNGYTPKADAQGIEIEVVATPAVIPVVKEESIYLFAPGQHTEGDGFLYQNRLYHDFFVRENKKDGLSVALAPKEG